MEPALPKEVERQTLRLLRAQPGFHVSTGIVILAIKTSVNGAAETTRQMPYPKEWAAAFKSKSMAVEIEAEDVVRMVWPATAAVEPRPTEFVMQVLEPTGGKVRRPKDWFYTESHSAPSYTWILSREDATQNPYTTGVRIQTIVGVKNGTGKNGKQFILDFVEAKKKEASKIIKSCAAEDQGLFTRICLETEEGPYHILYSLHWGNNDFDVIVTTIAGTTKELWDTYSPTFDKMSAIELIDMKRFAK